MSQKGLMLVFESMIKYQNTVQQTQQLSATTTNFLSVLLMKLYPLVQAAVTNHSTPPSTSPSNTYAARESEWATELQLVQAAGTKATNPMESDVQKGAQELQTLGNSSQEISQLISTVDQILSVNANLLQSLL